MKSIKKPQGHQTVIPYIRVEDPLGFIKWTQDVFGAQQIDMVKAEDDSVRHAQIKIDDSVIMLSQAREEWPVDNATFYIYLIDLDKTFQKAVNLGADNIFDPYVEDYGAKSAGLRDPFGNYWWLAEVL